VVKRSYMQVDGGTTLALTNADDRDRAQEKLALVIPTLCEAENIGGLLDSVRAVLDPLNIPYEILVVDDDSSDGTGELVSMISQQDPRVRLLVRKGERGLSGAILHGWQHTDAGILGVMDADLQPLHARRRGRRMESGKKASLFRCGLGNMADSAAEDPCERSHVRFLHAAPQLHATNPIPADRIQVAAGDSGAWAYPIAG